ncbi:hypothetical protein GCM10023347_34480 [Streptomyces chumphonensis]|uniref:Uncharacterized protein n=1 Tax=Streptomyces chumphonensis TaxID=1214925 RepID=A0A927F018_9ACTN|nr:hypothetical protein [Streptomyces chumphonensis]MBD3931881.1 hypothetical protein [Streptomyces chumphonensis]
MAGVAAGGARSARDHALAVLRVRGTAFAAVLLPGAGAVVLLTAVATGHLGGAWAALRLPAVLLAVAAAGAGAAVTALIARARTAVSPTVPVAERAAPDLYRMVRELAGQLDVPVPSGVALTPDCDCWLEEHGRAGATPPVLVVGSPFLWWMRVAELRALLAPVVAGTGPAAHPDIAAARRFVRALDAAAVRPGVGRLARLLLRASGGHAAEMERLVAAAVAARAADVERGPRLLAQEQVGLAYAGWDRLLTRVALPAWRAGRWPSRLDVGVVSALTELSRRDRLAEGFTSRLGERPACDLLEDPGEVDERVSLLAARLFYGAPPPDGPDWAPVDWPAYPREVVDRVWRTEAARLFRALDATESTASVRRAPSVVPAERPDPGAGRAERPAPGGRGARATLERVMDRLAGEESRGVVAARITADAARDERRAPPPVPAGLIPDVTGDTGPLGLPAPAERGTRELLADHITAVVCCAAVDGGSGAPGLDWLDGPALLVDGERRTDLRRPVLALAEEGDAGPLRDWLTAAGLRPDRPVRLA